jgi:hypothetical protein
MCRRISTLINSADALLINNLVLLLLLLTVGLTRCDSRLICPFTLINDSCSLLSLLAYVVLFHCQPSYCIRHACSNHFILNLPL